MKRQITVQIKPDADGYVGRECPVEECLGYFKITPGTGITEPAPCHCPYCGHVGEHHTFFTQEQRAYGQSVALRQIAQGIQRSLKSMEFEHRPRGAFGIGVSLRVKTGSLPPIRSYREKELETELVCDRCTLRYAIYGVFAWCPDCGAHNSIQILEKNLEVARKELALATQVERELSEHLIGDALKNTVSAFDGFGRQLSAASGGEEVRFQNIEAARRKLQERGSVDIASFVGSDGWSVLVKAFQKRHLLAHRMGVIDADYAAKAGDPTAVVGRKVALSPEEVTKVIDLVQRLGRELYAHMQAPPSNTDAPTSA